MLKILATIYNPSAQELRQEFQGWVWIQVGQDPGLKKKKKKFRQDLKVRLRLALKCSSWSSCLHLPNAGITGMIQDTWFKTWKCWVCLSVFKLQTKTLGSAHYSAEKHPQRLLLGLKQGKGVQKGEVIAQELTLTISIVMCGCAHKHDCTYNTF